MDSDRKKNSGDTRMGYYRSGGDWNRGMAVAVKEVESKRTWNEAAEKGS